MIVVGQVRGVPRRSCRGAPQAALYQEIDLELVVEAELPERERTKHVHRLHPYLGKYVPQLVEVFLRRYARPGQLVWDPFAGSGTTLVEANAFGAPAAGCDISAFNCLLTRVKTAAYERDALLADAARLVDAGTKEPNPDPSPYLRAWFAPRRSRSCSRSARIEGTAYPDLWRVVLSRAARSARLHGTSTSTSPASPCGGVLCHKHRRTCRPVEDAASSCAATCATRSLDSSPSPTCGTRRRRPCCTATPGRSTRPGGSTSSSRHRLIQG